MSVRKTIFEWGIWLLHTLATCRIYGITEESGTHAPWLFTSYDPWDEAARSCKYSASSMLWWTMFPNVPHLSQQTSKRHYHPLVYPSFIGFIMFYEYHHGGSNSLTSLPRFGGPLAPGAFLSRTRPRCLRVSLRNGSQELQTWQIMAGFSRSFQLESMSMVPCDSICLNLGESTLFGLLPVPL